MTPRVCAATALLIVGVGNVLGSAETNQWWLATIGAIMLLFVPALIIDAAVDRARAGSLPYPIDIAVEGLDLDDEGVLEILAARFDALLWGSVDGRVTATAFVAAPAVRNARVIAQHIEAAFPGTRASLSTARR